MTGGDVPEANWELSCVKAERGISYEEEKCMAPLAVFTSNQLVLQRSAPDLLNGLESLRGQKIPMIVTVNGYKHSKEIALALLNCAHFYDVTVMIIPGTDATEQPVDSQ